MATALQTLCNSLVKATEIIDLSILLTDEECVFGQELVGAIIKTNCQRFLADAKELHGIKLYVGPSKVR